MILPWDVIKTVTITPEIVAKVGELQKTSRRASMLYTALTNIKAKYGDFTHFNMGGLIGAYVFSRESFPAQVSNATIDNITGQTKEEASGVPIEIVTAINTDEFLKYMYNGLGA